MRCLDQRDFVGRQAVQLVHQGVDGPVRRRHRVLQRRTVPVRFRRPQVGNQQQHLVDQGNQLVVRGAGGGGVGVHFPHGNLREAEDRYLRERGFEIGEHDSPEIGREL